MDLVFIYGKPAVGKLTIARELEKLTGYKLVHLHLVVNPAAAVFEKDSPDYFNLVKKISFDVFTAAAKQKIPGILFTYWYWCPASEEFVRDLIDLCNKLTIRLCFVYLETSEEELMRRVLHPSRLETGKITSPELLKEIFKKVYFSQIPYVENLVIDTTHLPSMESAHQIVQFFNLPAIAR